MMLEATDIWGGYGKDPVISGISFCLDHGEVACVLGPNGSGKTTLFRTLLRFLPLMQGCVRICGEDASSMSARAFARKISFIPQTHESAFGYTVEEIAMMGRACHVPAFSIPGKADAEAVEEALSSLRIVNLRDRRFSELSGGQQRLALIARALAQQAQILIMDEPSSDLDYANQMLVQNTITELRDRGYAIILSTHAPEYPYSVASKVLLLKEGKIVSSGTPDEALTPETLSQAFGIPMDVVCVRDAQGRERKMCIPL